MAILLSWQLSVYLLNPLVFPVVMKPIRIRSSLGPLFDSPLENERELSTKRLELARARAMARAWAEKIDDRHRTSQASLFTRETLISFGEINVPGFKLSPPLVSVYGKLDESGNQLARIIGRLAATLPTVEACHIITSLYSVLLPSNSRSALGAFYTPHALARRLLDMAEESGVDWKTARVLDPASGGGAFLFEAALRMRQSMEGSRPDAILEEIGRRLRGFEIDPHAAAMSQAALEIVLGDLAIKSGKRLPSIVQVVDTLKVEADASFDLVVGNPPYGRVTLAEEQRIRYSRSLYGHANLYGIFTDIAVRWCRRGGAIAFLTPTSVLGGQYYVSLRRLLAEEAPPIAIDFVHARKGVFEDVLQETLLALYRRGGKRDRFQVHYLNIEEEGEAKLTKNGTIGLPQNPTAPWLAPRQPSHAQLIAAAEKMSSRLSSWGYEVSTGPLVWNRFKPQLYQEPGRRRLPLIWAEAVTSTGRFVFRAKKKNHAPFFEPQAGDEWLVVNKDCVLVQRTTAKEQQRRLIAAELPRSFIREHGGVVVENHLNMIRSIGKAAVSATAVTTVLNSEVVDQLFRCISGSVAVSAFELRALPLPDAGDMEEIQHLLDTKAPRFEIEAAIRGFYGLPRT